MIHRKQVQVGEIFSVPGNATLAFQEKRQDLSVWYDSHAPDQQRYTIVATGDPICFDNYILLDTAIIDGLFAYHLIQER